MAAPKGNLGGGVKAVAEAARVGVAGQLPTPEQAEAAAAAGNTAALDAAVGFVATMAASAPEGASVAELKAFAIGKQAEAYSAGKAVSLVERSGDAGKIDAAKALKTNLDTEATAAYQRFEAARKAEKDAAVESDARLKAKNEALAFKRKQAFHAASESLMAVKAKVEAEFKSISDTMTAKRAQIAALEKQLRRGHNLAEWGQFDDAVAGVKLLVESDGE